MTNSINFFDRVTGLLEAGRAVNVFYLDFSMAFSAASIRSFTEKLMKYRLDDQTVSGIENRQKSRP